MLVGKGVKKGQSNRRKGHDYGAPADYFVTVCVRNRDPLLGMIDEDTTALSQMGRVVWEEWTDLPERFPAVRLDTFAIMPNHVHGIIRIVGAPSRMTDRLTLGD